MMKKSMLITVSVAFLAACAFGQGRDLYKWRNRLLEGYQYMDLKVDRLPRMVTEEEGGIEKQYLVFTYRLSNVTEQPFVLMPSFQLRGDTGAAYPEVFREEVFHKVRLINGRDYMSSRQIMDKLWFDEETGQRRKEPLLMPGQTLYGAAAFEEVDPRIDELIVYGFGLTDSYRVRTLEGKRVTLIEAKISKFLRPGDRFHPDRAIKLEQEDWEFVELQLHYLNPDLLPEEK